MSEPTAELAGLPPAEAGPPVDILIVDDRAENLLALEAILEPLGQRLVRASSGNDALKQVLTHDFACILLDVQMPGMNGFEAARLIKSRERSKAVPIIFLTAINTEETYVFQGYSVGAVDYISKPFQPDILRSKVSVFVDLYRKQRQLRRQQELLREAELREAELRHRAEMRETETRLAEVVGSAMDAIVMYDEAYCVTLFNAAAERMFGASAAEVIGQRVDRFFPDRLRDEQLVRLDGAGLGGGAGGDPALPRVVPLVGRRATGEEFPVEASVSSVLLDGGRAFTLIARDVTERVQGEEALRAANAELNARQEELERAMTARSRFYASMSHELRTPINAILGYSTLMLENIYGPLNEKQAEGLRRTHKAAKHLLELVNDVLDLSKIEAGKIDLKMQPVNFPELVEDLFVTVRPMADENGCELTLEHEGPVRTIVTDPRRVRQILLNLLSNAIKFGRGKPIRVVSRPTEDGGQAVAVQDAGPGIAPADRERIFDEFVQLGRGQHSEGTGLGLPISRRLAVLLHGQLTLDSELGKGSTFTLVLPASAEARTAPGDALPAPARAPQGEPAARPASAEQGGERSARSEGRTPPRAAAVEAPR